MANAWARRNDLTSRVYTSGHHVLSLKKCYGEIYENLHLLVKECLSAPPYPLRYLYEILNETFHLSSNVGLSIN